MKSLAQFLKYVKNIKATSRLQLHKFHESARMVLDFLGNPVIITDVSGKICYLNPIAEQVLGWNTNEIKGQLATRVIRLVNQATGQALENPITLVLANARTTPFPDHAALLRRGGRQLASEGNAAPIFSDNGTLLGAILILHDVRKSREMAARLAHHAHHDPLTGLVNRRKFEQRAKRALVSARTNKIIHAVCYMDLDQFKIVNDTCGHVAGDELLRRIAMVLQSRVRHRDTLARLGGDEFGLLLENCPLDRAEHIAREILHAVKNFRFDWQGKSFTIGVSIGLSAITASSPDIATVMSATDAACYAAKEKGRNRIQIYQADDAELQERQGEMRLVSRLSHAIEENHFTLFYQPVIPLNDDGVGQHGEIFVRMIGPQNELVPPDRFIPAAERYNLMPALDRWVIQNAFLAYSKLYPAMMGDRIDTWAINISGTSLASEGLVEFVREQANLHNVPPRAICFEITETAAIANIHKAIDFITRLKREGFCFALDDFGKGMSSFSYLKALPVDYLKIDGHFVKDILHDNISFGMVEAVNRIAHMIGIKTIAECVESEAVLHKLKEMDVDFAQGYVIGKPTSLDLRTKIKSLNEYRSDKGLKKPARLRNAI